MTLVHGVLGDADAARLHRSSMLPHSSKLIVYIMYEKVNLKQNHDRVLPSHRLATSNSHRHALLALWSCQTVSRSDTIATSHRPCR